MATTPGHWLLLVGVGVLFSVGGAGMARISYHSVRKWRSLGAIERVDATDVAPGHVVAVSGAASDIGESVHSAVAGGDVLVRRTRVGDAGLGDDRYRRQDDWHRDALEAVPFRVVDDTGSVRVDPPDGVGTFDDLVQARRNVDPGGSGRVVDPTGGGRDDSGPASYLREQFPDDDEEWFVRERFVEPGDEVLVTGRAVVDDDGRLAVSAAADPGAFHVRDAGEGVPGRVRTLVQAGVMGVGALVFTPLGPWLILLGIRSGPFG